MISTKKDNLFDRHIYKKEKSIKFLVTQIQGFKARRKTVSSLALSHLTGLGTRKEFFDETISKYIYLGIHFDYIQYNQKLKHGK